VYLNIPDGTPNGTYSGTIHYRSQLTNQPNGVVLSLDQPVSVAVSGNQVLNLSVVDVSVRDVEVGQPLRIEAAMTNNSNVNVTPVLSVNIATSANLSVATLDQPFEAYKPGESKKVVALEWSTAGQQPGAYTAPYTIKVQGRPFGQGMLAFHMLPVGSLSRAGRIESVTFHGSLSAGSIARADVVFRNTGKSDVLAQFTGQISRNGQLIAPTVAQTALLAPVGQTVTLNVFFPVEKNGRYELRGRVTYEGAQTDEISKSFLAGGWLGYLTSPTVIAIVILLLVAGGVAWVLVRRRQRAAGVQGRPGEVDASGSGLL
jgi:hypothetical protein